MNEPSNILRGILHPDGTLELAGRPTLPAGDVEVTIRPVVGRKDEGALAYLQRIRAEREAAGYPFRSKEEIDAELAEARDRGDERLKAIHARVESGRPAPSAEPTEVTDRPATGEAPKETLWESMQRSRAELEASGYGFFRTKEEIDAYVDDLRDWDGKVDEVYRQLEEERGRVAPQ